MDLACYFQVGLEGESLGLYKVNLQNSSLWKKGNGIPTNQSLIWYKVSHVDDVFWSRILVLVEKERAKVNVCIAVI